MVIMTSIDIDSDYEVSDEINVKFINKYINNNVIEKFRKDHDYTHHSAEILFKELKKYLLICANENRAYPPSKSIDKIWHTFILFTLDYTKFCNSSFGRYIHHSPITGDIASDIKPEPFSNTIAALKRLSADYNEHFWEHLAPGDGDEDDDNGCTHNDCGPIDGGV